MLGTGGPASSSRGEVVLASSSGGEPPVEDVVVAVAQLVNQMGLQEPSPPDDGGQVHVSGAPPMARRPKLDNSELVPHREFRWLRQGLCKDGECQVLVHSITGEQAPCDRADKWSLHSGHTSGFGYIISDQHEM